jgi:hypothetical protein
MSELLDRIADPALWAEQERKALIDRLADWAGTTTDQAKAWLDAHDAYAIDTARRKLEAEAYTDVPVDHWYH